MSLSTKAIDRLFDRLSATYGAQWHRVWDGVPMNDVKSLWAQELAGFENNLDAIVWALENLPERAPNVIVFRNLCRNAPTPPEKMLPLPKADPARMAAELAKLGTIAQAQKATTFDHKSWAKRILSQVEAGDKVRPVCVRFAKEALGMA